MRRCFDENKSMPVNGMFVDFGILNGNSVIVAIKTGFGGNVYGFQDRYLDIAKKINKMYGYTVIVSSNPSTVRNFRKKQMCMMSDIITEYVRKRGFASYSVYYIGVSNGAVSGLQYGHLLENLKSILCIGLPISFFPSLLNQVLPTVAVPAKFVFGSLDENYSIHFKKIKYPLDVQVIENQNHSFTALNATSLSDVMFNWIEGFNNN